MPAHRPRTAAFAVVAGALLVLAACSSGPPTVSTGTSPASGPTWIRTRLGPAPGADLGVMVASDNGVSVVGSATAEGSFAGYRIDPDGSVTKGRPLDLGGGHGDRSLVQIGNAVRSGDGWVAVGTATIDYRPVVIHSDDGATWTKVDATGMARPAEVQGLAAVDGGALVAVGTLRTAEEPRNGGFVAATWRSIDGGTSWKSVDLPVSGANESVLTDLVAVGDALLATGKLDQKTAWWRSSDGGQSWKRAQPAGLGTVRRVGQVVTDGHGVLASVGVSKDDEEAEESVTDRVARSTDSGRSWSVIDLPHQPGIVEFLTPSFAAGQAFAVADRTLSFNDPGICYAEPDRCTGNVPSDLLRSTDDAKTWTLVDSSGLGLGDYEAIDAVVGVGDDNVAVISGDKDGLRLSVAVADRLQPVEPDPVPEPDVPMANLRTTLKPGVVYGYPLFDHCGIEYLNRQNGRAWKLDPAVRSDSRADPSWPRTRRGIRGYARLSQDGDRIDYLIGDGAGRKVAASYVPTDEQPAPCR